MKFDITLYAELLIYTGYLFDGTSCISLGVYDFATFEDFYKEVDLLNARWTRTKAVQND